MIILITGGAGYIGSHTVIELLAAGHQVVVVDSLVNSSIDAHRRVEEITEQTIPMYECDLRDADKLEAIFKENKFDGVIHFAGLKAVGESVSKPLDYYQNNLNSSLVLFRTMQKHGVKKLVFSSSATVYGEPDKLPITEEMDAHKATNPYGQTKVMIEQFLRDLVTADDTWQVTLLRYFNPIGAHRSGRIGEDPNDIPNNLMPFISQVSIGKLDVLKVFGNDYETVDGTGVRDYIHVVDLAKGHVAALEHMPDAGKIKVYNLGTGRGVSVLELIKTYEQASGKKINYKVVERRAGDIASCYADVGLAEEELDWKAEKSLLEACADSWRWQSNNPDGFKT